MSKRTNIEVLFDSVYTINQVLENEKHHNGHRGVLQANVDYIKHCLKKEEFTKALTAEQTASLNKAVADAESLIATLPANENPSEE